MTSTQLTNLSLFKIGVSKTLEDVTTDNTREGITARALYNHQLRATLRHYPWAFATKYADLVLVQGPAPSAAALVQSWASGATYVLGDVVEVGGVRYYAIATSLGQTPVNPTYWSTTPTTGANGDWTYAYRWPIDCLFARRIVPASGSGRMANATPIAYRIGRDVNGRLIYSNEPVPELEYTTLDCGALWADDCWIDAFTWRFGSALAPSLSRVPEMALTCWKMYLNTLDTAEVLDGREQQQEKDGDAPWIADR